MTCLRRHKVFSSCLWLCHHSFFSICIQNVQKMSLSTNRPTTGPLTSRPHGHGTVAFPRPPLKYVHIIDCSHHHWPFPVARHILYVSQWYKQEVVPPLVPVDGHGAVFVHSTRWPQEDSIYVMLLLSIVWHSLINWRLLSYFFKTYNDYYHISSTGLKTGSTLAADFRILVTYSGC